VKEEQDAFDIVQFHEILTLATQLLSTDEITAACGQRTAAAGHVEAIVLCESEFIREKGIRRLLQPPVRAGDDESARASPRPLTAQGSGHRRSYGFAST
jgi:hypothetical protein